MKALWAVIAILAVLIIGWLLLGNKNTATTPTTNTSTNNNTSTTNSSTTEAPSLVVYSDDGFSPSTITVKKGTTVTFRNDSSSQMWIASDPHPTHTDLPGFDGLRGYNQGESYTYTFEKVGTWGYHNHLNSSDKGTVVVQ